MYVVYTPIAYYLPGIFLYLVYTLSIWLSKQAKARIIKQKKAPRFFIYYTQTTNNIITTALSSVLVSCLLDAEQDNKQKKALPPPLVCEGFEVNRTFLLLAAMHLFIRIYIYAYRTINNYIYYYYYCCMYKPVRRQPVYFLVLFIHDL